jgi:hypothetical protein
VPTFSLTLLGQFELVLWGLSGQSKAPKKKFFQPLNRTGLALRLLKQGGIMQDVTACTPADAVRERWQ